MTNCIKRLPQRRRWQPGGDSRSVGPGASGGPRLDPGWQRKDIYQITNTKTIKTLLFILH